MAITLTGQNIFTGQNVFSKSYLLDNLSDIPFAFSFDQLSSGASSLTYRFRRDSDNKEEDFGYNVDSSNRSTLDLSAISAWQGIANLFCTRYPNQGTYGGNLVQTTAGYQPQFIIDPTTGLPCLVLVSKFLALSLPDVASVFINNFTFFSSFVVNSYPGLNAPFITINEYGRLAPAATGIDFYYTDITHGERIICKAAGAWGADAAYNNLSGLALNTAYTVSASRNNTTAIYVSKNRIVTGSDVALTAGPIQWPANTYYNYGNGIINNLNQNSFIQIVANAYLSARDQQAINNYMIARYTP